MPARPLATGEAFTARSFARPRIVLSQCLELEACRYDGQRIRDSFVAHLMDHVDVVPVCPEVEIGLGTPRDTIRLVDDDGRARLVQPTTGRDLTDAMKSFATAFLDSLGGVDGFVLKSSSPTCGTSQVKVYARAERSPTVRRDSGLFAREILSRFPHLSVEDEGRLRNFDIRHHYLTRLFSLADLRALGDHPRSADLVDFHRRYKHLLFLYDEPGMRELGRIVANADGLDDAPRMARYADRFRTALAREPRRKAHVNVLMHIYGHFKNRLPDPERHEFLQILDEFRDHHLTLRGPLSVIRAWTARFEYDYMADQAYLEPYPRALLLTRDSGKGVTP